MTDISVLTGCGWLLSEAPRSGHRATMAASSRGGQAPRPRRWEHSAGVQVGDGVVVVAVTGRIDQLAVAAFRQELLDTWQVCVGTLLVDLSACTHLSTDAIETLRTVRGRSPRNQCQLQIRADHPDVRAVLDTANIAWTAD